MGDRAFSAITFGPPEKKKSYKWQIIETSRTRYSRTKTEVEREITFRPSYKDESGTPRLAI